MAEAWNHWEGKVVDGQFPLRQYLGGSDRSGVFLTSQGEKEGQKAAIRLVPADPATADLQLGRWNAAAKLTHPHLLHLHQMGRCRLDDRDLIYLVMEYAEDDLSQLLPHRPLTEQEAREMLEPLLDAVAYLHARGFVHGHLKPANIMAVDGRVKISSDGIDRARESVSPAGDIWSLGVTLVETLTQRLPVWQGSLREPVLPETLPSSFREIARHCLEPDAKRRWTVAELAAKLQLTLPAIQQRQPARPASAPAVQERKTAEQPSIAGAPPQTSARRNAIAAVVVGLGLAAVLVGPRLLDRSPEAVRTPSPRSQQPPVQPESAPSPAPEPKTPRPGSDISQGSGASPAATGSLGSDAASKPSAPGLVRGTVAQQVLPEVSDSARSTIRGTLRVQVRVLTDLDGSVVAATFDSAGPSKYFADRALQAARRWKFEPPKVDGRNVRSEWILWFEYTRGGVKVVPRQTSP